LSRAAGVIFGAGITVIATGGIGRELTADIGVAGIIGARVSIIAVEFATAGTLT